MHASEARMQLPCSLRSVRVCCDPAAVSHFLVAFQMPQPDLVLFACIPLSFRRSTRVATQEFMLAASRLLYTESNVAEVMDDEAKRLLCELDSLADECDKTVLVRGASPARAQSLIARLLSLSRFPSL
eukprot:3960833-Pleurochrysis_carterae.AAC.1